MWWVHSRANKPINCEPINNDLVYRERKKKNSTPIIDEIKDVYEAEGRPILVGHCVQSRRSRAPGNLLEENARLDHKILKRQTARKSKPRIIAQAAALAPLPCAPNGWAG